jgi:exodeoxyribonuclease VII large subunit
VVVQGDSAATQVSAAIEGFNALPAHGPVARPDILIVARGGGSVEDLWPFNDEALARAVVASAIPLISAVGHETDTTLIDFVSDRRAPTPTAAAEIATPVLAELRALVSDFAARMHRCGGRAVEDRRGRVQAAGRSLSRVPDLIEMAGQRYNIAANRLAAGLEKNASAHERDLVRVAGRLSPLLLQRPQRLQAEKLAAAANRLRPTMTRQLARLSERFDALAKLYGSVDPDRPLQRGFARVHRADGSLVHAGASLSAGEEISLKFADATRQAVVDGAAAAPKRKAASPLKPVEQGDLF